MLPTPDTSHVSFDNVYEPAEDSYLLLDTLAASTERAWLQHRFQNFERHAGDSRLSASPIIVEVGVGSGVVLAFVTGHAEHIFGRSDICAFGTDVNSFACRGATETVMKATHNTTENSAVFGEILRADLTSPVRNGMIDVLIFNPPYVPTEAVPDTTQYESSNYSIMQAAADKFERDSHLLALSYAGGIDGMETTDRLLAQLPHLLHPFRGVAYVLLCAQNKPLDVRDRMKALPGINAEIISSSGKQAGWEKLQILRIWKCSDR